MFTVVSPEHAGAADELYDGVPLIHMSSDDADVKALPCIMYKARYVPCFPSLYPSLTYSRSVRQLVTHTPFSHTSPRPTSQGRTTATNCEDVHGAGPGEGHH